jgi:hypothetical protein
VHEEPCTFDINCQKLDCPFRHSDNKKVTQLLHTTVLRKGETMGFNAKFPTDAVVITIDSNTLKVLGVEVKPIVVDYWYEEQHGGELPPGHREAADRINAAMPNSAKFTGNAEVLEEYSLDPAGKRVPKYRVYNMRRFYVETCLDLFNSHAEQVCFEDFVTILGQMHCDLDYLTPPTWCAAKSVEHARRASPLPSGRSVRKSSAPSPIPCVTTRACTTSMRCSAN